MANQYSLAGMSGLVMADGTLKKLILYIKNYEEEIPLLAMLEDGWYKANNTSSYVLNKSMKNVFRSTYNIIFLISTNKFVIFMEFRVYSYLCIVYSNNNRFILALWYVPHVEHAFWSVEYIMREVQYGWLIRYLHSNGASLFFFAVYIHMAKAIYYSSYTYPREWVWYSGFIMFMLMIITAFFVMYSMGQMSYWAATVITSLISTIPIIGGTF